MANKITITPDTNKVELTDQRRQILVTDNRTGVTINVTQTTPEIVIVAGRGPAGISGVSGPTGSVGPSGSTGPPGTATINTGVTAGGNILPDTANTRDIGSADKPFKDLYLSGSTLFLGDTKLSTDAQGGLQIIASGSNTPLPSALSGSFTGSFSGSFEGIGTITSASHAETASFAVSASVEIVKELSSSFADTASVAQSGTGSFSGSFTGSGEFDDIRVKQYIYHKGDENTFINFTDNRIRFNAGGINFMSFEDDGSAPFPFVINNGGNRINFRVMDRNSDLLLKTDSEALNVGLYHAGNKKLETISTGVNITGSVSASQDIVVDGNVFVQGTLDAATKNFKIDHPTMPGYYLIHSSLEGPERGIYHRGKLSVSNIIHLPDYWKDLPVDEVDITVQLTPIGNACIHYVKKITKETIEIGCDCGKPNCFYIVHAQRFDQGRLEILEPKINKKL